MKHPVAIRNTTDVVTFLKRQHDQIRRLLTAVAQERGRERQTAFFDLRKLLAIHETAEEEIVHPMAARARGVGKVVVEARLKEEKEAKEALVALEKLDIDSLEFEAPFNALRSAVLRHAETEEHEEFDELAGELSEDQMRRMTKAVQFAEATAPTRPHTEIESAAGNMLVAPFITLVDRARDAIEGRP